ncbi:FG-GAP-like repeat-containing protein [Streptomyces sp. GbtcB6]|uniref:FG-GAP-like repeat-containing protein n=1 Tax=Streptomyces sp. GbtcB6 TaxID=2824751 RepID=UPI0027E460E3|nr:FG-GAP-like repeat-containing protein [Streptomyces sp. GbtcB6]
MGRYALPRRRLAVAISSVALVLTGGAVLPTTAVAAPVVPWTSATALTGTDVSTMAKDLVTAPDGSAVAIWNQFAAAGSAERRLYAAVRPAGSDTWGAPALLTTTPDEAGNVKLHASADGTVTALWMEYPDETSPGRGPFDSRVVSSVLAADHSGWSAPVELVGTDASWGDGGIDLAEAPDGTLTAVWGARSPDSGAPAEVYGATRGADGTWSAPAQLSDTVADGADGAHSPSVAVTSDGTTVVVYKQTDGPSASVRTVSRAAGAAGWTAPAAASPAYQSVSDPEVTAAGDGTATVAFEATDESEDEAVLTATRSAADGTWAAPETVTPTDDLAGTPEPLIAPDGDVTLVWVDYTTTFSTRTATRDAATGTWSAVRTLSTSYVPEAWDAVIADDGTVHALWPQTVSGKRGLAESVRGVDGAWSAPTLLPGSSAAYVLGQVSVGEDGAATAVWSGATSSAANWQLFGSRTAWPALAVGGSSVPATAALKGTTTASSAWAPTWTLSRPTSSWTVTLTDAAGKTVRTLTGSTDGLTVAASWNGRTTSGAYAPNGPLSWTLSATQQGAAAPVTLASGKVTVTGGAAVARDFGGASGTPDGAGDLLTLNSSGGLTYQLGTRTGTFSGKVTGSGWAASTRFVPYGDVSGDRCDDVLVRTGGGALRLYKPACGKALTPSTSYTTLGSSGWNQYDVLTSPGDVSGDGRPDLIARNSATGAVYLYKGTSTGRLSARVKLYDNWKTYKKVVGVGDLDGDGVGDLLAQDKSNNLYRYSGTGKGAFKARVKLFGAWGGSYNAVVGVGDITGDGRADLVSRDTSGNVYRNSGDGKGSFAARVKIAGGWGGYKSLS